MLDVDEKWMKELSWMTGCLLGSLGNKIKGSD